jgi:hypothetical protein
VGRASALLLTDDGAACSMRRRRRTRIVATKIVRCVVLLPHLLVGRAPAGLASSAGVRFFSFGRTAPTAPVFASWRGKPFRLYDGHKDDGHKDCLHRQAVENAGALRPVINLKTAKALGLTIPETSSRPPTR